MGNVIYGVKCLYWYVLGKIKASVFYEKKYISGKHFATWHSVGWRWVVNDRTACRRMRRNLDVPFPTSPTIKYAEPQNIIFDPDDLNNFHTDGCYYQAFAPITIGKGTFIAPNVGIITANHDPADPDLHLKPQPVILGEKCWLGMNSVILPGVVLGDHTVVAAGAVVTKSFPEGHCILGGVPARILKTI